MLIITTRTSGPNTNTTSNANAGTSMTAPIRRFFATRTFAVRPPRVLAPCGDCDEWVDEAISRFLSFSGSGVALPRAMGYTPFTSFGCDPCPFPMPDAVYQVADLLLYSLLLDSLLLGATPSSERSQ
ncbi:MAG: hypothetical protein ACLT4Y_09055 [Bifidobacterium breve]